MNDFFEKPKYTEEDIERIINESWEESLNLEFKSSDSLNNTDLNKKEISKDISAFANSAGGIVIYGIRENKHVAEETSFVDGGKITKEWLEHIINSSIQRKINDILICPVRFNSDVGKSIYVIKLPRDSDQAPHMARDNRYYKRYNFQSVPMEEYEVRNAYTRLQKTDLSIVSVEYQQKGSSGGGSGKFQSLDFEIFPMVKNESNSIEHNYKMEVEIKSMLISEPKAKLEEFYRSRKGKDRIYSVHNVSPLFQNETTCLCPINIRINKGVFRKNENLVVKITLFFSSGSKNYEFDLRDILQFDGAKISEDIFSN